MNPARQRSPPCDQTQDRAGSPEALSAWQAQPWSRAQPSHQQALQSGTVRWGAARWSPRVYAVALLRLRPRRRFHLAGHHGRRYRYGVIPCRHPAFRPCGVRQAAIRTWASETRARGRVRVPAGHPSEAWAFVTLIILCRDPQEEKVLALPAITSSLPLASRLGITRAFPDRCCSLSDSEAARAIGTWPNLTELHGPFS